MFKFFKKKNKKKLLINGFDEQSYLEANPDVREAIEKGEFKSGLEHLEKYGLIEIKDGRRKFHNDYENFNEEKYLEIFRDVKEAVKKGDFQSGFEHFCKFGYKEIINENRNWFKNYSSNGNLIFPIFNEIIFSPIIHKPLISIIIINYNGSKHFNEFFNTLFNQTYDNFEVIFVDNNSSDNSLEEIENIKNNFKQNFVIIENKGNIGFAEANNIALKYAKGELIALVNIDTLLDSKWLEEMFNVIKVDSTVSAVTSKTLFYKKFNDIVLSSKGKFNLNFKVLFDNLKYKKFFVREGILKGDILFSNHGKIIISLPIDEKIRIKIIENESDIYLNDMKIEKNMIVENIETGKSKYIINNAGSVLKSDFTTADRGYGEYDNSQYNEKCYLDLFCGVSVLIRRSAIVKRELFIPELFGYYEDSELSVWMRKQGFNILYAPKSVVYHKHSSSFNEFSKERELLIKRNFYIYKYAISDYSVDNIKNFEKDLKLVTQEYKGQVKSDFFKIIESLNSKLIERVKKDKRFFIKRIAIGVYNSFWNTKGGGEKHILEMVSILQKYGDIYLISEYDFDIKELENYFNIKLYNCKKIIESKLHPSFTKNFDIFINSTYNSSLVSYAEKSFYIVSFPHQEVSKEFLNSYIFLNNSYFTKKWSDKWWKNYKNKVIYPLGGILKNRKIINKKEKVILSVGRFFVEGHSKNQLQIAKSFVKAVESNQLLKDWRLVLIGGINKQNNKDIEYLENIKQVLNNVNYEIILDADFEKLNDYYNKAYIYVHATGMGKNINKEPQNFEHFGITLVEAIVSGCYPIVFNKGGIVEIIKFFNVGETFGTEEELTRKLINNMRKYPKKLVDILKMEKKIKEYSFEKRVIDIILGKDEE